MIETIRTKSVEPERILEIKPNLNVNQLIKEEPRVVVKEYEPVIELVSETGKTRVSEEILKEYKPVLEVTTQQGPTQTEVIKREYEPVIQMTETQLPVQREVTKMVPA